MSIYEEEEKEEGVFMRVQLWREEPTGLQCRTLHNPVLITLTGSDKKTLRGALLWMGAKNKFISKD